MGVIVPLGECLVAHRWTLTGDLEPCVSTYGIRPDVPTDTLEAIAGGVRDAFTASGYATASNIMNGWTYRGFTIVQETSSGPITREETANVSGTLAGTSSPINCALLIRKRTAQGGRRNRGRLFFPPAYMDRGLVNAAGVITGTTVTENQNRVNAWRAALILEGLSMVLFHSAAPTASAVITSLEFQGSIATQRRRLRP